ncbi:MAG: relaxase/mobilization nuclease domain-containing protein [Bacteroidetes bacterium]|nr:relaxase/mobilization nuclease domain-containing protein [Bacteroidota bacterium]
MVARIRTGKSIAGALNYNEQKLKEGQAECIAANNFLKDVDEMHFYDKLRHFERLTSLNEQTKVNTLHVSLNFDPSEKLNTNKLRAIAEMYMQKIGFGNQPYLVYHHHDAAHPHLHIVSTNIRDDGSRISLHNLGKIQSENARKEIEREFNLVRAEGRKLSEALKLYAVHAHKLSYGKSELKRSIANVLLQVIDKYKYASLAELNAILKLYNIEADRGAEGTRMRERNGLQYRVLDQDGNPLGVPIKASSFYFKPTLASLEKKFVENESLKHQYKQRLKAMIDWQLNAKNIELSGFISRLEKEKISTVLRQNKEGLIYGMTFIDHQTKCVFNGSDLGKYYSASAIMERCTQGVVAKESHAQSQREALVTQIKMLQNKKLPEQQLEPVESFNQKATVLDELLKTEQSFSFVPYQLKKGKRKRKRESQSKSI